MAAARNARISAPVRRARDVARRRQRLARRRADRRGVLILVVLSLLVLFLLIGIAFVLSSGQFHSSSRASSRMDTSGTSPRLLLDGAMYQALRDTTNPGSVLRTHSLLSDMYGLDGFTGFVESASFVAGTGSQLIDVVVKTVPAPLDLNSIAITLNATPGFYAGCVFTAVSGNARANSMRIVDYPSANTFRVLPVGGYVAPADLTDVRYVVNGRPFNGTGAGFYHVQAPPPGGTLPPAPAPLLPYRCNATETVKRPFPPPASDQLECALLPNRRLDGPAVSPWYIGTTLGQAWPAPNNSIIGISGGPDESYDAPDFQNMFLAAIIHDNTGAVTGIIPSFHRPDLLRYWENRLASARNAAATIRNRMSLRVSTPDEPTFYTAVPADAAAVPPVVAGSESARPYDVDNDGDGIVDSVWVDLGFPVQVGEDGLLVKPLFAFLIVDLDGRLNVNAAGSRGHYEVPPPTAIDLAGGQFTSAMPSGQGFGPAEISLERFMQGFGLSSSLLMQGNGTTWYGRYGVDGFPGIAGYVAASLPQQASNDFLAVSKFFEHPLDSFNPGARGLRNFGLPSDLRGRLGFGLGLRGEPLFDRPTDVDLPDNPYELNLNDTRTRGALAVGQPDMPFSPAELERLLRYADIDTSELPRRLWDLMGSSVSLTRRSVTTDSRDVPAPHALPTADYELTYSAATPGTYPAVPLHITEMMRMRLLAGGVTAANVNAEIALMLSADLRRGTRMDINRPLGNAADDDANTYYDEPFETSETWIYGVPAAAPASVAFDHTSAGAGSNNNMAARQVLARHLYVLAMLLKDSTAEIDFNGDASTSAAETAQGLAQWAINVVDFRDADSVMSPFEFDLNPWNGWGVDGDISAAGAGLDATPAERGLVWGCERPELLLTETGAWHDRATEELNDPGTTAPGNEYTNLHTTNPGNDPHFDQREQPRGSAFVELYNPWMGDVRLPDDLYMNVGMIGIGVHLNKMAGTSPVWRLLFVSGASKGKDFEDPDPANQPVAADVERSVYFANPTAALGSDGAQYYTTLFPNAAIVVPPGNFAVVGSSGTLNGTVYESPIGRHTTDQAQTRTVSLNPDPAGPIVEIVLRNGATPADPIPPRRVIQVPIDFPRSFSVSEPTGGYATTGPYAPPLDEPLDFNPLFSGDTDLMQNVTVANHRTVYLQRLANPHVPFDANTNPYLTIDMMAMNLTPFNGVTNDSEPSAPMQTDSPNFVTVERGTANDAANTYNLWRSEPLGAGLQNAAPGAADHYYDKVLKHTLGFFNRLWGPTPSGVAADQGAPAQPFPWLNWHNRPYASQYELLEVPFSRSSRLLIDYPAIQATFQNPYTNSIGLFQNHLNFFLASQFPTAGAATRRTDLVRLLDYLHVPSRFLGTDTELNPVTMSTATVGLRPPFNRVSNYRDPGKVNINTIYNEAVWDAILDGHAGPLWAQLVESRRGWAGAGILPINTAYPTVFANPFRSADAHLMVPLGSMEQANPVNATLMRAVGFNAGAGTAPLFPPPASGVYNNPLRNPYFCYDGVQRMGNLVTTHSNVYAVWITVGYFEVSFNVSSLTLPAPAPVKPFALSREVGSDMGSAKRNRAFYIIDRSIPVAFEPGQNHNVDNAVLLRRFIE